MAITSTRLADGRPREEYDGIWWIPPDELRCDDVRVLSDALGIALRCELSAGHPGWCQADEGTRTVRW